MDLYQIIGVAPSADTETIRSAYRALARRHHPDAGGNAGRMAEINEAWAVLGDTLRRFNYDREHGHGRFARPASNPETTSTPTPTPTPAPVATWTAPQPAPRPSAETSVGRTGRILDFGRYAGWSILELSKSDPDYLLWLERTPIGRSFQADIAQALEARRQPAGALVTSGPAFRAKSIASGGLIDRLFR